VRRRKLQHWLESFVEFCSDLESPPQYHVWSGLTILSAALQKKVWLRNVKFALYPHIYVFIVGPPGAGKTAAANIGVKMLKEATAVRICADRLTPEALLQELAEAHEMYPVGEEFLSQSPLLAYCEELSVFLGDMLTNTQLLAQLTSFYDAKEGRFTYRTKTAGRVEIDDPCLVWLGCTTPEWIQKSISPLLIGGGLTSRIIIIYDATMGPASPWPGGWEGMETVNMEQEELRTHLIHDLEIIHGLYGGFRFASKEVYEAFEAWYKKVFDKPEFSDERLQGYGTRKRREHVLKISMLLSAAHSNSLLLEREHIQAALALLAAAEPTMLEAFGHAGRSAIAEDVALILKEIQRVGVVSRSHLLQKYKRHVDKDKLDKIIATLSDMEEVYEMRGGKSGYKMFYASPEAYMKHLKEKEKEDDVP
jgi:energy-coupling factor transporter ATP-binding protein EcfA2